MNYDESTIRLLKELRGKLKSFENTEKDIEHINQHLSMMNDCKIPNSNNIINEIKGVLISIRSSYSNLNVSRRKLMKFIKDNKFYLREDQKCHINSGRLDNDSITILINFSEDIIKQNKE